MHDATPNAPLLQHTSSNELHSKLHEALNPKKDKSGMAVGKNGKHRSVREVFPLAKPPHVIYDEEGCTYKAPFSMEHGDTDLDVADDERQEVVQKWMPKALVGKGGGKKAEGSKAAAEHGRHGFQGMAKAVGAGKKDPDNDGDENGED